MSSFGQGGQGWRDSGRRGDDRRRGRGQQREFSNSANFSQWGEDTNRRTQLSWRRRDNDGPSQGGGQPRQQDLGNYQSNLTLNQRQQTGIPYGSQASNNLLGYKKSEDPDYADSSMDDPEVWKYTGKVKIDPNIRNNEDKSIRQCFKNLGYLQEKQLKELDEEAKEKGNRVYRPGFGTKGVPKGVPKGDVNLWANYFAINFDPEASQELYIYNFDIVPADKDDSDQKLKDQKPADDAVDGEKGKKVKAKDVTIKGHFAKLLVQRVLNTLDDGIYATDFVGKIILRKTPLENAIKLSKDNGIKILPKYADSQTVKVQHMHRNAKKNAEKDAEKGAEKDAKKNYHKDYHIRFKGAKEINLLTLANELNEAQAPDKIVVDTLVDAVSIIVGHSPRADPRTAAVGQGRFFKNMKEQRLHTDHPQMLAILRGFFQSVRPSTNRLLLNVNVAYSVFRPNINLGLWLRLWGESNEWNRKRNRRLQDLATLHKIISKTRIIYKLPRERDVTQAGDTASPTFSRKSEPECLVEEFAIAGFVRQKDGCQRSCKDQCTAECRADRRKRGFDIDTDFPNASQCQIFGNKGFVTVEENFSSEYASRLRHPELPVINRGRPDKPFYIPAERCWIVFGQRLKTLLNSHNQQRMKTFSCRKPYRNVKAICEVGRDVLHLEKNMVLQKFGISIGDKLVQVPGRVLPPRTLLFSGTKMEAIDGKWSMRSNKLLKPRKCKWTYLILDPQNHQKHNTEHGIRLFKENFGKMGLLKDPVPLGKNVWHDHCVTEQDQDITSGLGDKMSQLKSGTEAELVLLIFPRVQPKAVYDRIKFIGDIVLGIHTVCVAAAKFTKFLGDNKKFQNNNSQNNDYFLNVGLKVNLKLGGTNHQVESLPEFLESSTMFAGYDVIHPTGPDTDSMKSQVGLVTSLGEDFGQWSGSYWGRKAREEIDRGEDSNKKLAEEFNEGVVKWTKNNGKSPKNIIIFRDGVSESQYSQVVEFELSKIVEKVKSSSENSDTKFTLVVAVKRHSTRFYPTDNKSMAATRNIKPGTVVDRGVPEGCYWEFYLTAHAASIGTARPARYVVLHDEIFRTQGNTTGEGAANSLEELTHKLCHMLGRATHVVSLCAPAYMADMLCTRARAFESAWTTQGQGFKNTMKRLWEADQDREKRKLEIKDEWERIEEGRVHPAIKDSMFWV